MHVQIFGVQKNAETRKALRFFAERRVDTQFVDLSQRAASLGELVQFSQRFGVHALIDVQSRQFRDLGLAPASHDDKRWLDLLVEYPLMLRLPLVRSGSRLSVGLAEFDWRAWLSLSLS